MAETLEDLPVHLFIFPQFLPVSPSHSPHFTSTIHDLKKSGVAQRCWSHLSSVSLMENVLLTLAVVKWLCSIKVTSTELMTDQGFWEREREVGLDSESMYDACWSLFKSGVRAELTDHICVTRVFLSTCHAPLSSSSSLHSAKPAI